MPQYWSSLLNPNAPWQTASGVTLTSAATPTTISPEGSGGTGADPQNLTWWQGLTIRFEGQGVYTCGSTATNATFSVNSSASGTALSGGAALATTGALALPVSQTGLWWEIAGKIQCRAIAQGTGTATLYTHGRVLIQTAVQSGTTGNVQTWPMPAGSGPTAASVDTTIAHTLGLVGTLSQSTGAPSITCTQFTIEIVSG
jgi:hypothetical protein